MIILKMAFRNIFRQRRRSILTGLTMMGGFILFALSIGFAEGSYGSIIDMFTHDHTGHVQIHKKGYLEKPTLYNTIDNEAELEKEIFKNPEVKSVTSRVYSPALAFTGKKTSVVRIIGVDPAKESNAMTIVQKVQHGNFLPKKYSREVVIGAGAAEVLKVGIGDEISLLGQGADGSIANDSFTVTGILHEKDTYNRINCYLHMAAAQDFLALHGRIHEIAVILSDQDKSREVAAQLTAGINDGSYETDPWEVVERQFYMAMQADVKGAYITQIIIMLIVAIGVLNTVLMTILERTREFGVLRAMGTRPFTVFMLIVYETAILCLISICIAAVLGTLVNHYFSINGISYPTPIEWGGIVFDTMISEVNAKTIWLPALVTFLTAIIVSMFPAFRAARVTPIKSLSFH